MGIYYKYNKIPVFAVGYFGIILSNNIKTKLFDFYPVPLNLRQKGMLGEDLASRALKIEEIGEVIRRVIGGIEHPPKPIFIVVDTVFNDFKENILPILNGFIGKVKVVLCVRVTKQAVREEVKKILNVKPHNLDLMIVTFEGNDQTSVHRAKDFFEVTDFILSSTGFINVSLRDLLTLGGVIFFYKYMASEIADIQKQVIEDFKHHKLFINHKNVKKIIISFKAPISLTVTDVNDALQAIITHLPEDIEVQWSLFASETDNIELFIYFGLDVDSL